MVAFGLFQSIRSELGMVFAFLAAETQPERSTNAESHSNQFARPWGDRETRGQASSALGGRGSRAVPSSSSRVSPPPRSRKPHFCRRSGTRFASTTLGARSRDRILFG